MSNSIGSTNLGSELLLNKIMNGTVQTESGKTVTMGNRVTSSQLNLDAIAPSISSANARAGSAQATAIQGNLSEMKDYLENLKKEVSTATNKTAKELGVKTKAYADGVAGREIDGVAVFGADTISVDVGYGDPLAIGANGVGTLMAAVGTKAALLPPAGNAADDAALVTWQDGMNDAIDIALNSVYDAMGGITSDIRMLDSRSDMLDDVAATYVNAAANQGIVAGGGANNLLTGVLS